jgi:hypothetical protein
MVYGLMLLFLRVPEIQSLLGMIRRRLPGVI